MLRRVAEAESITIDDAAVQLVARAASGSFRDAVSMLDQLSTASSEAIGPDDVRALLGTADEASLFRTLNLVAAGDAAGLIRLVDELTEGGTDLASFTAGLLGHLRGLFLTQQLGAPPGDLGLAEHEREQLVEQAERVGARAIVRLIDMLRAVVDEIKEGSDPRLPLELALVRVSRPQNELGLEALEQRLARLEQVRHHGLHRPLHRRHRGPFPPAAGRDALAGAGRASGRRSGAARHRPRRTGHAQAADRALDRRHPARAGTALGATARAGAVRTAGRLRRRRAGARAARGVRRRHRRVAAEPAAGLRCGGTGARHGSRIRYVVTGDAGDAQAADAPEHVSEDELVSRIAETFDAHEV